MKQSKFFRNIYTRYMAMVLMFTLMISILIYFGRSYIIKNEFYQAQKVYLQQTTDEIDTKLSVALQSIRQFENDTDFLYYCQDKGVDSYSSVKVAEKISKNVNAFSNLGYYVAFSKNSSEQIISSYHTDPFEDYFRNKGFSDIAIKNLHDVLSSNNQDTYYIVDQENCGKDKDGNLAFMVVYKKKYSDNATMNFFISFLDQSLIPNVDGLGKKHFLIVNNNKIITSKGLDLEEDILSELKSKKVLPLKKSEFYTRLHVKNYTVHLARSNIFADWTYIYISSNNSSLFTIDIFISMVTFIILSMVGAWFAFANIRKIYTPIQSVVDVLKPYGFDEEADEIENIKKTAVTISSINEELSRIVKDKSVHMKNKFLTDLLYGMLKEEDIKRMIDEYRLQRFQTPLHIIIIELLNPLGLEEKVNKEKVIEIKNSIAKSISAALEKNCHCTVLELDYRRYAAIATEVNTEILRNVLNNSIYTIEMAYDLELVAAIGKEISSITEAEISFNDAMVILEHKHILSKKAVLTAEELKNVKDISYYYPIDIERNLLLYITNGDREKARAVLQNLLNINLRQHTLSKEGINEFIYAIVATIKRLLQQMNKTVEEVFGEGSILYLELKTCQNIEQLEDKIQEIFKAIITKMHSESIEDDQSLIERMLAFVRENYQKDISLTDISEAFNVSMGYTSRLFKNQANTNFKDYLNLYRIQRAKELFKQGNNVKINDVAMEVGCNNATTFFRIFKKYEGISPGEYMKNMN